MRRLMWITVGFSIAAALYAYVLSGIVAVLLALFCGLCAMGLLLCKNKHTAIVILTLMGFATGLLYCWGHDLLVLSRGKSYDGQSQWVKMEAEDYGFSTTYGTAVDGKIKLDGHTYRVRMYLSGSVAVEPGDVLSGRVRLQYTADGGAESATYHKGEGILLLAYAEGIVDCQKAEKIPVRYFASRLRKSISDRLDEIFPSDTAFFVKAVLLGDDSQISFADNIAFQKSGIRHVVAVSGLHVSVLFSMLYFATGKRKLLTLVAGIPVLFLFAAVAGFSPSVVRACIMQGLIILSVAVDRDYDPVTGLSVAVLFMLAVNPLVITSAGFQLSVACMIGIFAFSPRIRNYIYGEERGGRGASKRVVLRLRRWFAGCVSISLSAMVFTAPLCAIYFGTVSILGIATNLMILWLISYIFVGIVIVSLISLIWMPGASFLALLLSLLIRLVLLVARNMARIPFCVAYTDSLYAVLWIVLSYGLLILYFYCKKKNPTVLAAGILLLFGVSQFLTWIEPYSDEFRLTVADVGQGQCVLLQSKDASYLIDCGGENPDRTAEAALRLLGANGITRLDGLILTHYDSDHAIGAVSLVQSIGVDKLYLPDIEPSNAIRRQLTRQDVPIQWMKESATIDCGAGELIFYPAENTTKGNESSMCILFRSENCDILITGDRDQEGERLLLQQGSIPDIEILVAGHHGAAASTGIELLNHARPELVLISVGADNAYGHPAQDVLERLEQAGCRVRRTDIEGTIVIRG